MAIRIVQGDVHIVDVQTRLPFKYGIATMTRAPQAFVRVIAEIDGVRSAGVAADGLPPKWFTKVADKPLDEEINELLEVVDQAVAGAVGVTGPTVFAVWQTVFATQDRWGRDRGYAPLLSQFGATLVERALIEAFCRAHNKPFSDCLRSGSLGLRLDAFDSRLAGRTPAELLPTAPLRKIIARHTVGLADPLEESEIAASARLNDGLPQALAQCIQRYGLKHFKLKVSGQIEPDIERLTRTAAIISRHVQGNFACTLDGNESFRTLADFRQFWDALGRAPQLQQFLPHALFVEQPFHRDMALDAQLLAGLAEWRQRPTLIIDESDAELDSFPRALALGYHGTSHKNCKGVFKGVANACLIAALRQQPGGERLVMSGEDLVNIGPVALLQDLAVVASLGVHSVERNGHHYVAGLSAFPAAVQEEILQHHGDLYERAPLGWPTLHIRGGELCLDSVVSAPLGVGFELDVTQFTPRAQWTNLPRTPGANK